MTWSLAETESSIPVRLAAQAARLPDKVAIAGTRWQPTFSQLDAAADGLAAGLPEGTGRVVLLLRHDAPLVAALLAVLKAGRVAVVLNPADPPARLRDICAEVEPEAVLLDEASRAAGREAGLSGTVVPDRPPPSTFRGPAPDPDALAFLIYTSGTTGRPRGVMQTHRNVLHNVLRHTNGLGLRESDRFALLGALSGAQGIGTLWTGLLNGATVCPFSVMDRGFAGLASWLTETGVTVLPASASVYRALVRTLGGRRLEGVRLVRLASERVVPGDVESFHRHFAPGCLLANTYSSSETGTIARWIHRPGEPAPAGAVPVGLPAEGIAVELDGGEIVVRGAHLSPGYWRDRELTARRFAESGETRAFRTGDLGELTAQGELTVTGRTDHRVKVHGSQVSLPDVEDALRSLPGVQAAAVAADATARGDTRLTAYVVPEGEQTPAAIRRSLSEQLPGHAVPARFVLLPELPVTANGKVDRGRLVALSPERDGAAVHSASGEPEELMAAIWARALDLEGVGPDEDFFALGGDSLGAAVIAAGVHTTFGIELELAAIAAHPTVRALLAHVEAQAHGGQERRRPPLRRAPRDGPLELSYAQERTWSTSRTAGESAAYTVCISTHVRGPLDMDALRSAVGVLVDRHEVLRTAFPEHGGRGVQVVHPSLELEIPLIDLSAEPDPQAAVEEAVARLARTVFDVERLPLLQVQVFRLGPGEHVLARVNHHIISDGWSWRIFFGELGEAYTAIRGGGAPDAGQDRLQYADYAAWERSWLRPEASVWRREVEWWADHLDGAAGTPRLPFARSAVARSARPEDGVLFWELEGAADRAIDDLSARAGATRFMTLLSVFAAQLAAESDTLDLTLGTYATNRRLVETQRMFGWFSNLTTLRLAFVPGLPFLDWLELVRQEVLRVSAHSEIPYGPLSEELARRGTPAPPIRAIFAISDQPAGSQMDGVELSPQRPAIHHMPWEFSLRVDRGESRGLSRATFDPRIHDREEVRAFVERYRRLLDEVCADPERPLFPRRRSWLFRPRARRAARRAS